MRKIILTEADKKKIVSEKEKAIIESFAKTFNKIKRIDENEITGEPDENELHGVNPNNYLHRGENPTLYQHIKVTYTDDTKTKVEGREMLYLSKLYAFDGPTKPIMKYDYNNNELNLNSRQIIRPIKMGEMDLMLAKYAVENKPSTTQNNFDNSIGENELEY